MKNVRFVSCSGTTSKGKGRRRAVTVNGRRVLTVDVHAHCAVPQAVALMGNKVDTKALLMTSTDLETRLRAMDAQGIDVEALSINPYWYEADRDVAKQLIRIQNEALAEICAKNPDRFVAFASIALQHPDLAVEQLEEGIDKFGLSGAGVGGSVAGLELADPKFHPFWAKAEQLDVLVFMHPQATGVASEIPGRLKGSGGLDNTIGNPLETTIALSHLIFQGTLDRFPRLKLCAAHGGGYLPSYAARSDAILRTFPARYTVKLKKKPTEYLQRLYFDSIVFTSEALRHLAAEAGPNQIVMGTDYPFPWTSTSVDHILKAPGFTAAQRVAMLGGTAMKLLGLKASKR